MKTLVLIMIAILSGIASAETPEEAFEDLMDAVYEGDAAGVAGKVSSSTLSMIDFFLTMIKLRPEQVVTRFSEDLGTELTVEDLLEWEAVDFIDAVISSPGFREELPPRDEVAITHFEVNGDSCTVFLAISGMSEPFGMEMIREGDDWKLRENLMGGIAR
jgi:hypothetical protein